MKTMIFLENQCPQPKKKSRRCCQSNLRMQTPPPRKSSAWTPVNAVTYSDLCHKHPNLKQRIDRTQKRLRMKIGLYRWLNSREQTSSNVYNLFKTATPVGFSKGITLLTYLTMISVKFINSKIQHHFFQRAPSPQIASSWAPNTTPTRRHPGRGEGRCVRNLSMVSHRAKSLSQP